MTAADCHRCRRTVLAESLVRVDLVDGDLAEREPVCDLCPDCLVALRAFLDRADQ